MEDLGPGRWTARTVRRSVPRGNEPACKLEDERGTLAAGREEDDAENSLVVSWDHATRPEGIGAGGTFVFELSRPLDTGDTQDAQFTLGGTTRIALACWDGNEGREKDGGWSDAGHAVSIAPGDGADGWREVQPAG